MDRRAFLRTTSLVALGGVVPEFLARAAEQATPGKDRVLVVVEMAGGNDGLNTVIPHKNDLYYRLRPTIGVPRDRVLRVNDEVGLHPNMREMRQLLEKGQLAIVQGVGYPNPTRSHFDAMDVWQLADPGRGAKVGWLARALASRPSGVGSAPAFQVGPENLPLALTGPGIGVISLARPEGFSHTFTGPESRQKARRLLLEQVNTPPAGPEEDLTAFVRRRQVETLRATEAIAKVLRRLPPMIQAPRAGNRGTDLRSQLGLVARLIGQGVGARIYYARIDGFDTHSGQSEPHANLLGELSGAVAGLFDQLAGSGDDRRVLVLTYSEFGRRVKENGSAGTDHGAASCLFLAGPAVKAGPVGGHPRLDALTDGDLRHGIDFRQVYATLLDGWLGCDSKEVLGQDFAPLPLFARG